MLSDNEQNYYSRQLLLDGIGEAGQRALKEAKVLVVGAGGLGCPVLTYLARAGVGQLGILDGDRVNVSNLHRQLLFGYPDLDKFKTDVVINKLKDINPYIKCEGFNRYLTTDNVLDVMKNFEIVVDATDNFPARYLINDACVSLNKPFVFASVDRFQGQLSVFNYNNGPTYRCVFPNPPKPETAPNCAQTGVIGVLPGILGMLQANEVIKIIVSLGQVLSGKLLMYDALQNTFYKVDVEKNPESIKAVLDIKAGIDNEQYYNFCNPADQAIREISVEEIQQKSIQNFQFIDIREKNNSDQIPGSIRIPLSRLDQMYTRINHDVPAIVYCDEGITSKIAVIKLLKSGFENVFNLKNGLSDWKKKMEKYQI